ncbi:MAG: hypothetical protein KBD78_16295 [Oligoflexales bacterium]|nr:hypothetical protein [Oligoflexales bacterium]
MTVSEKLELYLMKLEKNLGSVAVSEKAEIITEIKSHILEALDRDKNQSIEAVLASLGEPEMVANKYLLERGLKPTRPPRHPIVKWLTIGFLGTLTIFFAFIAFIVWSFSPLLKVDETTGRVSIMGGMGLIDIDGDTGSIKYQADSSTVVDKWGSGISFNGDKEIDLLKTPELKINFNNGDFTFIRSESNKLIWDCKGSKTGDTADLSEERLEMHFKGKKTMKCTVEVPDKLVLQVSGINGRVQLEGLHTDQFVNLENGQIIFEQDEATEYNVEANVKNGQSEDFESHNNDQAYKVFLNVKNGQVKS